MRKFTRLTKRYLTRLLIGILVRLTAQYLAKLTMQALITIFTISTDCLSHPIL